MPYQSATHRQQQRSPPLLLEAVRRAAQTQGTVVHEVGALEVQLADQKLWTVAWRCHQRLALRPEPWVDALQIVRQSSEREFVHPPRVHRGTMLRLMQQMSLILVLLLHVESGRMGCAV